MVLLFWIFGFLHFVFRRLHVSGFHDRKGQIKEFSQGSVVSLENNAWLHAW
jgi:hypothetical protein